MPARRVAHRLVLVDQYSKLGRLHRASNTDHPAARAASVVHGSGPTSCLDQGASSQSTSSHTSHTQSAISISPLQAGSCRLCPACYTRITSEQGQASWLLNLSFAGVSWRPASHSPHNRPAQIIGKCETATSVSVSRACIVRLVDSSATMRRCCCRFVICLSKASLCSALHTSYLVLITSIDTHHDGSRP